jgi:endonuclease YncB( thermonuclease family)
MSIIAALVTACAVPSGGYADVSIFRVKDGDTFEGTCTDRFGFPETYRLANLDTPENGRFAKCRAEAVHAAAASAYAKQLSAQANNVARVKLPIGKEKYGRYRAQVEWFIDGRWLDWSSAMIKAGYAVSYSGGKKINWCAALRAK